LTSHTDSSTSEHEGVSRRELVQMAAAGAAAAGLAAPASAQTAGAGVVAEATAADYVRDPTRWGSAEVAALFPGFKHVDMRTKGAIIRLRHGGSGPPLLMLHGHPVNHVSWYKIAARLAQRYHVVCADLRGYGDSSLPEPGPNGVNYSFRVMYEDVLDVMEQLGHRQFYLIGHDRGARLSHRLCLDHPERVLKVSLIDGLPTYHVFTNTTREWALNSWHWSFLAQPEPFPETLISSVPPEWYLKNRGGGGLGNLPKPVFDEFVRCYTPKTIKGTCHDYRANAHIDFEMDRADKDKKIPNPLLILWGTRGGAVTDEYPTVWRRYASNMVAAESFNSGHYLHWDVADQVYDRFVKFFVA
jgi:haloacetate dehalogenase